MLHYNFKVSSIKLNSTHYTMLYTLYYKLINIQAVMLKSEEFVSMFCVLTVSVPNNLSHLVNLVNTIIQMRGI